MKNELYGYSLFNDIEDQALQERNRAVVMANMAEAYTKKGKISLKGTGLIVNYFNEVPEPQRMALYKKFESVMLERGFNVSQ